MGIYKFKPNAQKYSRVANNEFEFCKFTCFTLLIKFTCKFNWFKNNQLLSELKHVHYREPVPLKEPTIYYMQQIHDTNSFKIPRPGFTGRCGQCNNQNVSLNYFQFLLQLKLGGRKNVQSNKYFNTYYIFKNMDCASVLISQIYFNPLQL